MALDWFGDDWASGAAGAVGLLPQAPGSSGTVSLAISEGSGKKRREAGFHWRYDDGKATDGAEGIDADADLVLLLAGDDAVDVLSGSVEPSVAFMRGRLKASGDGGLLLRFLRSTTDSKFCGWREKVAALVGLS